MSILAVDVLAQAIRENFRKARNIAAAELAERYILAIEKAGFRIVPITRPSPLQHT